MLLLPFVVSNLFREEVDEHNSHHRGAPYWGDKCIPLLIQAVSTDYTLEDAQRHWNFAHPLKQVYFYYIHYMYSAYYSYYINYTLYANYTHCTFIVGSWIYSVLSFLITMG